MAKQEVKASLSASFSASSMSGRRTRTAPTRGTCSTRNGLILKASTRCSHSTSSGDHRAAGLGEGRRESELRFVFPRRPTGSTTGRRSASTSPGWGSTQSCSLWPPSWAWAVSFLDTRRRKPARGGQTRGSPPFAPYPLCPGPDVLSSVFVTLQ